MGGILRNGRGTAAGLFAAWFNVPFVVLMSGIGFLVGGITGTLSGTVAGSPVISRFNTLINFVFPLPVSAEDLVPDAGAQIGGIIGGILGAFYGGYVMAWLAFVWPWQLLYDGDPMWPIMLAVGQVLAGLFVAVLYTIWSVATERTRLTVSGARRLSRREERFLMPLVREGADGLGLRHTPRVLINDSLDIKTQHGARHIVLYQGFLDEFKDDRSAIAAVIVHLLAHWRNADAVAMNWSKGAALPLYLVYELAMKLLTVTRSRPVRVVVRMLLWSVTATVDFFVIPVQRKAWRAAEYRADEATALAGHGAGLTQVLTRVRHSFEGSKSGWDNAITARHPPNELRLEQLEEIAEAEASSEPSRLNGGAWQAASLSKATLPTGLYRT